MFRASSADLQEDTVVHVQHMVLSLSMRILGTICCTCRTVSSCRWALEARNM